MIKSRYFSVVKFFFNKLMLFWAFLMGATNIYAQQTYDEKHIDVVLRMVGHQVLLKVGDSTSKVLPIVHEGDQHIVQFDTTFEFLPEELVGVVNDVMTENNLEGQYILQVEQCETGNEVYSYEIAGPEENIIPCQTRAQPKDCYQLVFTFFEPTEDENLTSSGFYGDSDSIDSGMMMYIIVASLIFFFAVFVIIRRLRINDKPNGIIKIGSYQFDQIKGELIIADENIELTGKESELLMLLLQSVNKTVEREKILNKVWGDEGDYVGRTLDVFISKLRKKLESDQNIKIANIRGVGYKLVIG